MGHGTSTDSTSAGRAMQYAKVNGVSEAMDPRLLMRRVTERRDHRQENFTTHNDAAACTSLDGPEFPDCVGCACQHQQRADTVQPTLLLLRPAVVDPREAIERRPLPTSPFEERMSPVEGSIAKFCGLFMIASLLILAGWFSGRFSVGASGSPAVALTPSIWPLTASASTTASPLTTAHTCLHIQCKFRP